MSNPAASLIPLETQIFNRRRMIVWLAGAGSYALLTGCGEGGTASSAGGPVTLPTPTPTACIVKAPAESVGPYPADGSNASSGATNNVLTQSGVVRSDIRSSFIGGSQVAAGVQLQITITLVNSDISCTPLANHAVYLWQADAAGNYSLYTAPSASYLRGVQVTDANGRVTFTTIVPGCSGGRYPHFHIEIFPGLSNATDGGNAQLKTQIILPAAVATAVYADTTGYPGSATNFAAISIATDPDFQDDTAAQVAALTPTVTGSVAAGYTAQITLGVSEPPSI